MKTKYLIGTSGWSYDDWHGRFYPKDLQQKKWLEFYSQHFNTVEINMTFYRWPRASFFKSWYNRTPKDFKFTLKATRLITHIKKLKNVKKLVNDFYKLASLLKEKLACILWQLPPSFKPSQQNIEKLENFLKILNSKYKNVIEFRNEEWWQEKIYKLLRKYNACFCIVSGIEMPKDAVVTAPFMYFRFHGDNYSSCYTEKTMKKYANEMKKLANRKSKNKTKEIYAYFNNDNEAYAVKNAQQLKRFLKTK